MILGHTSTHDDTKREFLGAWEHLCGRSKGESLPQLGLLSHYYPALREDEGIDSGLQSSPSVQ